MQAQCGCAWLREWGSGCVVGPTGGWRRIEEEKGAVVAKPWPSDAIQMDGWEGVR
jgi:hypothetical protein